jgi:hypothetical protein
VFIKEKKKNILLFYVFRWDNFVPELLDIYTGDGGFYRGLRHPATPVSAQAGVNRRLRVI